MPNVTVTYLQIFSPSDIRTRRCPDPRFVVKEATTKQWQFNRFLYQWVGQDWLWVDKLSWTDEQWQAYAESDALRTLVGYHDGSPAGYFELHQADGEVQIAYFGLGPRFIGRGLGGFLLTVALQEAFKMNPSRVWVHTCTRDHPGALSNYQARGMAIYREEHYDVDPILPSLDREP